MPNDAKDLLIDSHEERLQRLEHGYQQTSTHTAELMVKMDYLTKSVSDKLDVAVERITEKVDESSSKIKVLSKEVSSLSPRVEQLEKIETERTKRKIRRAANFRKIAAPIFIAGAGVIATKLGELIWLWLSNGH